MLKLKHHIHLPSWTLGSHTPLHLAPVPVNDNDNDELTQAIAADPADHDDNWTLEERPDTRELESFWSEVTTDLKKDPDWTDFAQ